MTSTVIDWPVDLGKVDAIVSRNGRTPAALMSILREIQAEFRFLPRAALQRVAEITDIPAAEVAGVSTFYAQFRHKPAGRHTIKVCVGTACHVKGAEAIYEAFRRHLGLAGAEDTDMAGLYTVEKVACLGCCMLAPAVQIGAITYGWVEPSKVGKCLADFEAAQALESTEPVSGSSADWKGEVRICLCTSCTAGGSQAVFEAFERRVGALGLPVRVRAVGCAGVAYATPLVEVAIKGGQRFRYGRMEPQMALAVLLRHFEPSSLGNRIVAHLTCRLERLLTDEAWTPVTAHELNPQHGADAAYGQWQEHLVTEFEHEMEPLDLDGYRAHAGFEALERCVRSGDGEWIIREITESGLRGRGGAGFPTGRKWAMVRAADAVEKHVIANGDEGDPGAFMDRMVLESFPFRVLEGLAIAAYAVGARSGFLYIRSEYPLALARVRRAVEICEAAGLLGDSVLGSGWGFRVRVMEGGGAFVCGEETALIAAIEGRRGMPTFRPPYPAERGLWGKPTLVNNVETLGLVPWIVRNGAGAFAKFGTAGSKGTKTFALAGKVNRGGLIEVPMGITLRRIVEEIGGGIQGGGVLRAIQVGGPSGGCVPARLLDTPVDYDSLTVAGAMMGSGGMVVLDEGDCMVDLARYFMTFTQSESCGKCTFCRVGTKRMLELLEDLCQGKGGAGSIDELAALAVAVQKGSLCGLGRTAPNPVLSTLRYFRAEYDAHVRGECPARRCRALIRYVVTDPCIGCTRCAQRCMAEAIEPRPHQKHKIDPDRCTKCDACRAGCPVGAIVVETGGQQ